MTHEPVRVAFRLDRDPALLSVIRAAVQFQAYHAGLDSQAGAEFAEASETVCHETLSQYGDSDGLLEVTLDTFSDRVEIAIRCPGGQLPVTGLESAASADAPGDLSISELVPGADRVLSCTEDGATRTTLVKYLHRRN